MSFIYIVIDELKYGASIMLLSSIPSHILQQWLLELNLNNLYRLRIRRLEYNRGKQWWLIGFEILDIEEKSLRNAFEVYQMFIENLLLNDWHSEVITRSEKIFGACGDGSLKGTHISKSDIETIANFMKKDRIEIEKKHCCYSEFYRLVKDNPDFCTPSNLQKLAEKFDMRGGKWLMFFSHAYRDQLLATEQLDDSEVLSDFQVYYLVQQVCASLLDGRLSNRSVIQSVSVHNYENSFVVGVSNRFSSVKLDEVNEYTCLNHDKDVKSSLEAILEFGMVSNCVLKYKPEIYSVCNISRGKGNIKPTIYTAFMSKSRTAECVCGAYHRTTSGTAAV